MSSQISENQKELISKLLLDYKRNSKIRETQNKYIQYEKVNGNYFYRFSFSNLKPEEVYYFYMKDMRDNYNLLFFTSSAKNGTINSFEVMIPECCVGESYDFILIPKANTEYYLCSIFPHPIQKLLDNKFITLDMIFPKGLLWSCYGENFEPNSRINVISFSGDEMISKKHKVDETGKFTFFVTPFCSNNGNKSKIIVFSENKDIKFELYYDIGTQCKPIQNKSKNIKKEK